MATFLGEVLSTADTATLEEFRDALSEVNERVIDLKGELVKSLDASFAIEDADIERVTSWYVEMLGASEQADKLSEQLQNEKFALTLSAEEVDFVRDQLQECSGNIDVLKAVVEVVQNLEKAEPESDIFTAAKRLKQCELGMKSLRQDFLGESYNQAWFRGLQGTVQTRVSETYEFAINEWNTKFQFEKNTLLIDPFVGSGDIPNLIEALQNLGKFPKVIERLHTQVWQELLSKACTPDYTVNFMRPSNAKKSRKSIVEKRETITPDKNGELILSPSSSREVNITSSGTFVIQVRKSEQPITTAKIVFDNVIQLLGKLREVFGEKQVEIMQGFGKFLGPKLINQLTSKCLTTLILQESRGSKQQAMESIAHLHEFRDKLQELDFHIQDLSALDEFETNFDGLIMMQVREDVIAQIRRLIRADVHETTQKNPDGMSFHRDSESEDCLALHKNPFVQERYTISRSIAEMVETLQFHLSRYPDDYQLVSNALNLYISIVNIPKTESEAGDFIPLTAVLIHNNCMYLSSHAETTFPMCDDSIPLLRTKANHAFAFMMRSVRTKLNGLIALAMAGLDEASEDKDHERDAKFLLIAQEFHKLNRVFSDVLPPRVWRSALATLVDHTVNEMCSKVIAWDDISATTANELAECFTNFALETSSLFKREGLSTREVDVLTSRVVQKWQRFRLLTFVLTASMKDIQDKWVNGAGPLSQCFTPDEIRKLVRALFQNTDRRAAFLSTIK